MFVRWQLYRSQARDNRLRRDNDKRARLKAILVESVRIDGKPCQRHIAFLGSISIDGSDRRRFWYQVMSHLDRLSNRVPLPERERIIAAIAKKVGLPLTPAELEQFRQDREELMR